MRIVLFVIIVMIPVHAYADVKTLKTQTMAFDQCLLVLEETVNEINLSANRIVSIVDTNILKITKIIADDANMIITCSKPDQELVITHSTPPDLHLIRK